MRRRHESRLLLRKRLRVDWVTRTGEGGGLMLRYHNERTDDNGQRNKGCGGLEKWKTIKSRGRTSSLSVVFAWFQVGRRSAEYRLRETREEETWKVPLDKVFICRGTGPSLVQGVQSLKQGA